MWTDSPEAEQVIQYEMILGCDVMAELGYTTWTSRGQSNDLGHVSLCTNEILLQMITTMSSTCR